jgi:hypothetical protein
MQIGTRVDVRGSLRIAGAEVEVGAKQSFALSVIGRVAFAMLAHRPRRPRLVLAHGTALADDVDCEDRGEAATRRGAVIVRELRPCEGRQRDAPLRSSWRGYHLARWREVEQW